jgi:hypothetical protein
MLGVAACGGSVSRLFMSDAGDDVGFIGTSVLDGGESSLLDHAVAADVNITTEDSAAVSDTSTEANPGLDRGDVSGDDWEARIEEAIDDADYVLVFLSPRSCPKESFFQKEIRHAMNRLEQMPEGERFILPVMIEQCELPRSFRKRNIHYQRMWEADAYEKLLRAVG